MVLAFFFLFIVSSVIAAPPTKYDYLKIDHQECGIVSCATYYTATNPTTNTFTLSGATLMKVASKIDYLGTDQGFTTEYLNASGNWIDVSTIVSLTVSAGEKVRFRVVGKFTPVYSGKDKVSYAIDHIPSIAGYTYPEYDLWNQTWNKCADMNITYNLGNFTSINETFPVRVFLNGSYFNLSAIRSDWGDLRFSKGTCANVISDYKHSFVYKNSTNAEAIFYTGNNDIVNNTVLQVAVYYNNSNATHVEPTSASIGFGQGIVDYIKIFTNDMTIDTDTNTSTVFNETSSQFSSLTTYGITRLMLQGLYGKVTEFNTTNSAKYSYLGRTGAGSVTNMDGITTAFTFRLYNQNSSSTQYLFSIGNATDTPGTKIAEAYITSVAASGDSGGTITTDGLYTVHTFTSNGTFTSTNAKNISILVVAGGGGGGSAGGGGGAGGLVYNTAYNVTATSYTVVVGMGGYGGLAKGNGSDGQNSSFGGIVAVGGGGGAGGLTGQNKGRNGGSGGGAPIIASALQGGTSIASQGSNGGNNFPTPNYGSGGGGGAGAVGSNGTSTLSGNGGVGLSYNISGTLINYSWGGGGGAGPSVTPGSGNNSGGNGGGTDTTGSNATALGSGGGGGGTDAGYGVGAPGGNGTKGIVIIRYLTSSAGGGGLSSATLNVTAYYYNASYSKTFSLGVLLNNVSYAFAMSAGKKNSTTLRTIVMFNGTLLDDAYATKISNPAGTYPFRQEDGTRCALSTDYTCAKNYVYGANGVINASGDVIGALNTINGSIDEIIMANFNGANLLDKLNAPLLYAWTSSTPAQSFSSSYVSNIYVPSISLAMIPPSLTSSDDANASVTFIDGDFESLSNVTFSWRVNGTPIRNVTINVTCTNLHASCSFNTFDVLGKGNYSAGSTVNITVTATDSLYNAVTQSISLLVGGIRPNPITGLTCTPVPANNKTKILCNWNNPAPFNVTIVLLNGSNIANVSNTTTSYTYQNLSPGMLYNLSFITVSADGTWGNTTSNMTWTYPNTAPSVVSYYPANLTPTLEENQTITFNATFSDDDGNPIISWFKNNVFQLFGNFFAWVIGMNDQGNYTIEARATDAYGANTSVIWNVTVNNTFPAPNPPLFDPASGRYRTYIPVKCASTNTYSAVDFYDMRVSVNNGSWEDLSLGNKMGFIQYDITQYNYFTNFTFNCTASGQAGNTSNVSGVFTRDYINEFYATTAQTDFHFTARNPTTMSLYYDAQKPNRNVTIKYAFADCNGDGTYDYVYNFTSTMPSRVKRDFVCIYPAGQVNFKIGVYIQKDNGDTWAGTGCSQQYDYSSTCLVTKTYVLAVES